MLKVFSKFLIPCVGIFFIFLGVSSEKVNAENLNDGLVGYYPCNGNMDDESGNEKDGLVYGANLTKDKFGKLNSAYNFDRITDGIGDYVKIPININPDVMPELTIIVWAKIKNEHTDRAQAVLSNDDGGWDRAIFNWYESGWGITRENGFVGYHKVQVDNWYFLAGRYDYENKLIKFRVNDVSYEEIGYSNMGRNYIYIGSSGHGTAYFDGTIDEVRIYNRVLSDEEIDELYNQFKGEEPVQDFSFVHMTDVHLGSSWVPYHKWYEELSYPRFADDLYEIGKLVEKPDFVLVSGDVVEIANERWLKDYKSITDGFTAQTGIAVHTVPGNHDRFRWATGNFFCQVDNPQDCDDYLAAYHNDVSTSQDEYFTHKGVEFIGLDSGADFLPDYEIKDLKGDKGIESSGLTDSQIADLKALGTSTPKVLYMHSPIFSGGQDEYENGNLEDASIANNREEFLDWSKNYNLKLALTGHTHRDEVYDEHGNFYTNIASTENRPLFIQTQSATHDSAKGHGYRIVKAEGGAIDPQAVSETGEHIKIISELDDESNDELRVFDPLLSDKYITLEDTTGLSVPFFSAKDSKRVLLYDVDDKKIKLQVWQKDSSSSKFGLNTRIEGVAIDDANYQNDFGYRMGDLLDGQFVHFHLENKNTSLEAKNISFDDSNKYQFNADFQKLIDNKNISGLVVSKNFVQGAEVPLNLTKMKNSIIASIFSPAELYVINSNGERTGIVDHKSVEEIDYSLSDEERERVLLYSDNDFSGENFIYRVQGIADIYDEEKDTFSLRIVYKTDDIVDREVNVFDMSINASTTYQFRVDWNNLSEKHGVTMEIDENGDGVFEIKIELGQVIKDVNPRQLRKEIISELIAVKTGNGIVDKKIDSIIASLEKSLNEKWWQNDYFLDKKTGEKVFNADLATVGALRLYLGLDKVFDLKNLIPGFLEDRFGLPDDVKSAFENSLANILRSETLLAQIAINDFAINVDSKKKEKILKSAEAMVEKAEEAIKKSHGIQVVQFYEQAWKFIN